MVALLIESSKELADILSYLLEVECKCESVWVKSMPQADKITQAFKFDVIFVDIFLNRINGDGFFSMIKTLPYKPCIIGMTSSKFQDEDAKRPEVDFVLRKPFGMEDLTQLFNIICEKNNNKNC